ncbi:GNAT family N-acetyltransferase [Acinetobacter cumulans]|jgi:L-amino acid N-acyltransferase YncA|uniref:N-acetyltransferase n=1 Tax=Acinetobacter cumulans TaxID=2136182 RepID=A0A498CZF3_9GAMM|nr:MULTISPECIES: GNAT family N-acetyltransferase [Acinetobacter]QCO20874.1 GNAT family N-acetyltransferase [Acinetobacter cumulans]RFS35236.1 N-acetyltransferase [Acinetobacter sp. SWAC5]RLL36995.1 N-acetyltransferase [Acinetobacter cumulans]
MAFIIRAVQETDLAEIVAIYNHEVTTGCATWNDQIYSVEDFKKKLLTFEEKQDPFVVIEHSETQQIAGYADYAMFRNFAGYRHTVEHSVYIHPQYARQGLGKRLMQHLIAHAKAHQVHVMVAGIDHDNLASIALHQQLGFVQTGYMPQVGQKFGQWRDLVLMQLNI